MFGKACQQWRCKSDTLTNLALAGSSRWSECSAVPSAAAPRSSGPTRCCSTSRATSRNPPTPASKRPCLLQQKHIGTSSEGSVRIGFTALASSHVQSKQHTGRRPFSRPHTVYYRVGWDAPEWGCSSGALRFRLSVLYFKKGTETE